MRFRQRLDKPKIEGICPFFAKFTNQGFVIPRKMVVCHKRTKMRKKGLTIDIFGGTMCKN
jgi:hypothetical protein